MKPIFDALLGKPLLHQHESSQSEAKVSTLTITDTLSIDFNEIDIVTATSYDENTSQSGFTLSISNDVINKNILLLFGKLASGATITLPANAEIISGAFSSLHRNAVEIFCFSSGKYMIRISQKTIA